MKHNFIQASALLICCIALSSCYYNIYTPYTYQPDPTNMPLAGKKGDIKITAYTAASAEDGVFGSYAADSNIVLIAGASINSHKTAEQIPQVMDGPTQTVNNLNFNAGAGYYKKLGKALRFEAIGGMGYGKTDFSSVNGDLGNYSYSMKASQFNLFAQSDIGLVYKNFEAGLGLRIKSVNTSGRLVNISGSDTVHANLNGSKLFAEPGLSLSAGFSKLKLNIGLGYSFSLINLPVKYYYSPYYGGVYGHIGLTWTIPGK